MRILLCFSLLLLMACTTTARRTPTSGQAARVLEGSYRSIRGVMDPLSCYCFNGGYLTTAEGERFALCFANEEDMPGACENLRVTALHTTKTLDPEPTSPCPAGERTLYAVQSFTCGD